MITMTRTIALGFVLMASAAWAIGPIKSHQCGPNDGECIEPPSDIDKAHDICLKHRHETGKLFGTGPYISDYEYENGWGACTKIEVPWSQSESARRQREAAEQEQRDRAFVAKVAGEQKP